VPQTTDEAVRRNTENEGRREKGDEEGEEMSHEAGA
jgi:hypothetical protein